MNKKAITEQVFIYIFVMIVIGLLLFFGIKMIKQTTELGEAVDTAVIKKDLENAVAQLYTYSERSSQNLLINNIPKKITAICIIDLTTVESQKLNEIPYEDIRNYAQNNLGSEKNTFLVSKEFIEPMKINHLKPSRNPLCKTLDRQSFKAKITNQGEFVIIE